MIRHVALVGMPGSGKSTVGPLVAARLGLPFIDTDAAIEARERVSIARLFAERGEAGFRLAEREALAALLDGPPAVLALGGGAFANPATRAVARRGALTVWLRAGLETLASRVGDGTGRPMLAGDPGALARLLDAREAAYRIACATVDAGGAAETVADEVARAVAAERRVETVPVGPPGYDVVIGAGLLAEAGARVKAATGAARALVVTDANVGPLLGDALLASLSEAGIAAEVETIAPGEASKGWEVLRALVEAMAARRLARSDIVVALGGGVVGDLAGFAAAIYMRGLAWVQVPTTLLAQVDSSVGGKTAIDLAAGKNLAGAFHDPRLVLIDPEALATLPPRELRSGYAEVLKAGLLGDARFFDWLEAEGAAVLAGEPRALRTAIAHSVRIKATIVSEDPREAGRRALLNLGHTFGHALEAETGFGEALTHGEAVALGCAMAFRFSAACGLCGHGDAARAQAAIGAAGLPARLRDIGARFEAAGLVARMRGDKKAASGGGLTLILARAIGDAVVTRDVDAAALTAFLLAEGAL